MGGKFRTTTASVRAFPKLPVGSGYQVGSRHTGLHDERHDVLYGSYGVYATPCITMECHNQRATLSSRSTSRKVTHMDLLGEFDKTSDV